MRCAKRSSRRKAGYERRYPPHLPLILNSEVEESSSYSSSSSSSRIPIAIRLTAQICCRTIGLFSLQKTPAHRGRRTTTIRTSRNFGIGLSAVSLVKPKEILDARQKIRLLD